MNTGSVRIKGPMTKEDKVRWDQLRRLKVYDKAGNIAEMTALLANNLKTEIR